MAPSATKINTYLWCLIHNKRKVFVAGTGRPGFCPECRKEIEKLVDQIYERKEQNKDGMCHQ